MTAQRNNVLGRTRRPAAAVLAAALAAAAGCSPPPDAQAIRAAREARRLADQARSADDFRAAAALYEQLRRRGYVSAALLYNEGNAWMRAGQRGRAVACYRQALRYAPRDPYLQANLRAALGGDAPPFRSTLLDHLFFWKDWIGYPAKFQLATAAVLAAWIAGLVRLARSEQRWRRRLAAAALAVALPLAASALYDWRRFEGVRHGVVVRPQVAARKGDDDDYPPAFDRPLEEGAEFVVVQRRNGWILIRLPAGQEGWIPASAAAVY